MRTVKLYGFLGKRFGRTHRLAVSSPAEAVRALSANFPDFPQAVAGHVPGFRVHVGDDVIGQDLLDFQGRDTIKIVPAVSGAKNGIGQIILGSLLIAAAVFIPGLGIVAPYLVNAGTALIIGGVTALLIGAPKTGGPSNAAANNPNYSFNGPVNTVAQGNCVPICYGRVTVGSQVISARLTVEQTTGRQSLPASGNVT